MNSEKDRARRLLLKAQEGYCTLSNALDALYVYSVRDILDEDDRSLLRCWRRQLNHEFDELRTKEENRRHWCAHVPSPADSPLDDDDEL